MNILVTGAAGMLDWALCSRLKNLGHRVVATDLHASAPDIQELNVRELGAVRKFGSREKRDAIMHLAAETNLEMCERDVTHAYTPTNTVGTRNVA